MPPSSQLPEIPDNLLTSVNTTYEFLEDGSDQNHGNLFDSDDYMYTKKSVAFKD